MTVNIFFQIVLFLKDQRLRPNLKPILENYTMISC